MFHLIYVIDLFPILIIFMPLLLVSKTNIIVPLFCSQTICDIHYQLTFVEQTSNEEAVRIACRSAQVALLNAQLDRLEERLGDSSAPHNKYANYFTTGEHTARSRHTGWLESYPRPRQEVIYNTLATFFH